MSLPCRSACRVAEAARSRSALGLLFTFVVVVDKRQLPLFHIRMIRRFGHRGLRRLYENDDRRGVNSELVERTARVLARLDVVTRPEQLNLPGFRLHRLEGDLAGYWSVTVEGEWRIIFSFDVENTTDVDLVEYH